MAATTFMLWAVYLAALRWKESGSSASLPWYTVGILLAVNHLLFAPAIAPKVQVGIEDTSRGSSTKELEGWLTVHRVRT
ncbi:uncharacterized protein N7487_004981 [Penicillium crustosum]|uniref:uncharacterized protein n=1 Tax=Penicillium crustosum TaxID=36656 RepID=UPI0023A38556|nr:uncharacterized protein N7487_004981 [Penicillium crustosum]KAJ5410622.1 hypothetical protein N7487_004981 [Penicillium crustosum]